MLEFCQPVYGQATLVKIKVFHWTVDTPCLLPYLISQKSDQLFMVAKKHVKVAILKQQKSEHAEIETREERAQY